MQNRRNFKNEQFFYKGYEPYGAGEYFILDQYTEDEFKGNIIEDLINRGYKFIIKSENAAALIINDISVDFVKRQ